MAAKAHVVTVREFLKLKGRLKAPTFICYSKKEWRELMKGPRPIKVKVPPRGAALIAFQIPGTDVGVALPTCPDGGPFVDEGRTTCVSDGGPLGKACARVHRKTGGVVCEGRCGTAGLSKCTRSTSQFGPFFFISCSCVRPRR